MPNHTQPLFSSESTSSTPVFNAMPSTFTLSATPSTFTLSATPSSMSRIETQVDRQASSSSSTTVLPSSSNEDNMPSVVTMQPTVIVTQIAMKTTPTGGTISQMSMTRFWKPVYLAIAIFFTHLVAQVWLF